MQDKHEEKSWGLKRSGLESAAATLLPVFLQNPEYQEPESLQGFYKIKINLLNLLCNS